MKILYASYKLIYKKNGSFYSTGSFPSFLPGLSKFFDRLYLISPIADGNTNNISELNITSQLIVVETRGFRNEYLRNIQNYLWSLITLIKFYKIQKMSDIVLIAIPSALTYIGYLALLNKPLIVLVAGNEQEVLSSSKGLAACFLGLSRISKLKENCEKIMLNRADLIICRNSRLIEKFECYYNIPNEKLKLVRNGIDLDLFKPFENFEKAKLRKIYSINDNDIVIGFIANYLSYSKGIDKLLSVFSKLKEYYQNIRLLLIGESAIPLPSDPSIIYLGLKKRTELPIYYNMIDIFLFPTRSDVAPKVVLEASSCGVPIIATNVGGIPELIIDGQTGFIVDIDDIDSMIKFCRLLIQDNDLRLQMGKKARIHALSNFDFARQLNESAEYIKNLIK